MAWQCKVLGLLFMSLSFNVIFSMSGNNSIHLATTPHLCHPDQSSALLQFKYSFAIDSSASFGCNKPGGMVSYPKTGNWKEGVDCCSWDAVTCDMLTGNVIGLELSCSWIQGPFNSNNTLFLLPHLQSLNLAFNNFGHSLISPKFGQLTSLTYLNLSYSTFLGIVPTEISHISKLVSLDLSSYYYELQFERWGFQVLLQNLTDLRELHLDYTDMSSVNLDSLSNLSSSLITLSLKDCSLYGKLPKNVFYLPNLQILSLRGNYLLNATFPSFNQNYSLKSLDLSSTGITGYLPQSIGELKSLEALDLAGCNFLGSIPDAVSNLTKLASLILTNNHFTSQIPSSLSNLKSLTNLELAENNLCGVIPDVFHNLSRLVRLRLWDNQLSGQIPSSIFNLNQITWLSLDTNRLSGPLPNHISGFSSLNAAFLDDNLLNGTLPSWLFSLPSLKLLYLSSNQFSGQIPKLFSNPSLELIDFRNNSIRGQLPNWLWLNTSLTYLDISYNLITSVEVHAEKLKMLQYLNLGSNMIQAPLSSLINLFPIGGVPYSYVLLSSNKLTGEIPISICNITFLAIVDFSNNSLSGAIPECLGSLNELSVLNLRMNNFNGTIPQNFSGAVSLRNLNLNGNQLEGSLPKSLAYCTQLQILDIGNNKIQGGFPNWLESLPELQVLVMRSNRFYGSIGKPNSITPFQLLRIMDISDNVFTGIFPEEYFKNMKALMTIDGKSTRVTYMGDLGYKDSVIVTLKDLEIEYEEILTIFATIDFSRNIFQGSIPEVVGNFISLQGLNFSHNNLSGLIPSSLANMAALESLDLSCNALVGMIPQQLTDLNFLEVLNVSYNQLEGPIPKGGQFETFKNDSFMGNSGLCGFPMSRKCGDGEIVSPPTSTTVQDEEDYIDWKFVMMGYATGLVIGLSMAYIVFTTRKPLWFVKMVERKLNGSCLRRNL